MELETHVDLAPLTTFGVPAKAEKLLRFASADELREVARQPEHWGSHRLVLGGGSNVLFTRDVSGLVLLNEVNGIELVRETEEHVWIRAGAGEPWHDLVRHTVDRGWGGLENLSLIPGKVGAAPMQNIGAYGVELKDSFVSLTAFHMETGELIQFDRDQCAFGYRESFFKREGKGRFIIMDVTVRLDKRPRLNMEYGAIRSQLAHMGVAQAGIQEISEAVMAIRRSKLPDPCVLGNAGSFFKNPVLPDPQVDVLREKFPGLVTYPANDGSSKVAAGWLIERAGWKGFRKGNAGVHGAQALVLVNHGGAHGRDVHALATLIQSDIQERFGIELEMEVNVI
ncbi:MAG: UDP-N-acetylmuramate dehydrogenase [Flavobacteriales bacterium]|nr:UDP-N-acetylmuramate dehydrogenase [Flavobacteriales bacterium]